MTENHLERIAAALERIAACLEGRKPAPARRLANVTGEDRVLNYLYKHNPRWVTLRSMQRSLSKSFPITKSLRDEIDRLADAGHVVVQENRKPGGLQTIVRLAQKAP